MLQDSTVAPHHPAPCGTWPDGTRRRRLPTSVLPDPPCTCLRRLRRHRWRLL